VIKPASLTPLTILKLADILAEAGLPDGVLNVVTTKSTGKVMGPLITDGRIRKLSFTGSTEVGRKLLQQASEQVLKTSMELGGNAPFVVFADADLDAAVEAAMVAKMRNAGESCIAANRFYVENDVAEEFATLLAKHMAELRVGPGIDPDNDVGPMINARACDDIGGLVDAAVAAGARTLIGGRQPEGPGHFFEPTVLTDVPADAAILDHEIFGPVAPVVPFTSEDEVIALANDTPFGLAAYVHAGDLARALRVAERLEAGMVGINRGFISDPSASFGGVKQSGLGREGGHDGLLEFMESKYVALDWDG
jgi:succinate-semialdehyde dehydrogenase / glutarate-semialdehyde dehydrogenase